MVQPSSFFSQYMSYKYGKDCVPVEGHGNAAIDDYDAKTEINLYKKLTNFLSFQATDPYFSNNICSVPPLILSLLSKYVLFKVIVMNVIFCVCIPCKF